MTLAVLRGLVMGGSFLAVKPSPRNGVYGTTPKFQRGEVDTTGFRGNLLEKSF